MKVKNLGKKKIVTTLETGQMLTSEHDATQDMLVTDRKQMQLQPGQYGRYKIFAMCAQQSKGAPTETDAFTLGEMSEGHLLELAQLIDQKQYQNAAGQAAVWCMTDDAPVSDIYGEDWDMVYDLRTFVSKAKGLVYEKTERPNYQSPAWERPKVYRIEETIEYELKKEQVVSIAVFDSTGQRVRNIFRNRLQPAGTHTYDFTFAGKVRKEMEHTVRVYAGAGVLLERRLRPVIE